MEKATAPLLLPSIHSPFPLFSEPKRNPAKKRTQKTEYETIERELKVRLDKTDAWQNSFL